MDITKLTGADWPYVLDLLPADLEETARAKLAMVRRRKIGSAADLLRLCLCYACCDLSLREVAAHAALLDLGQLSDVAVMKRLCHCADWLGHVVLQFLTERGLTQQVPAVAVRVVDATTISEPGSRGSDWRVHLSLDLARQQIHSVELTSAQVAEGFSRHQPQAGEIMLADRGYAHRRAVAQMLQAQAHVVVRLNWFTFPLQTRQGQAVDLLALLRPLRPGQIGDWPVQFEHDGQVYPMRLLAIRKTEAAAARELKRLHRDATRKARKLDRRTLQAAHFIYVLTDLDSAHLPAAEGLELYRLRWQIELVFKRLKSLLHLDHLRAKAPALARTYLYAKLLGALLVDELSASSLAFFPWGYRLFPTVRQSLALAADLEPVAAGRD